MATDIQSINLQVITATTSFTDLNSISIINQSADILKIINAVTGNFVTLLEGQTLTITASTGFVLPRLELDSGGQIRASVITT